MVVNRNRLALGPFKLIETPVHAQQAQVSPKKVSLSFKLSGHRNLTIGMLRVRMMKFIDVPL